MTWETRSQSPEACPAFPGTSPPQGGGGSDNPSATRAALWERKKEPRGGGPTGRGGAGPGGSPRIVVALAVGVCGSRGAGPGGRGVSRCRSWRCRRWWSTPWCCSVWWIISIGERAARGVLPGPVAPPLLSHGALGMARRPRGRRCTGVGPGSPRGPEQLRSRSPKSPGIVSPAVQPALHELGFSFLLPSPYDARVWGGRLHLALIPRPRAHLSPRPPLFA